MDLLILVFSVFGLILFVSFLIEAIVEAVFGQVFDRVPKLAPFKWLLMYVAYGVGILGAFIFRFDLIYLVAKFLEIGSLSAYFDMPDVRVTVFGMVLTGLAIGRGSNFLHDVFSFVLKKVQALKAGNLGER